MDTSRPLRNKTRVLYIVESFATGVYAIVREIACNLDPKNFTVHIIHSLRSDSPKNYESDFEFPHITLQYVPMGLTKEYVKAIREIRKCLHEFKPDTIHLHSSKAGFLGRIAAHSSPARLLYTPHGISFIRTDVGKIKKIIFYILEKWAQWYSPSRMIAVSEAELENVKRLTYNATAINNFIDVASMPKKTKTEKQLVGITGRITEAKNPPLFNRIASGLPDVEFIWIGDGLLRNLLTASNITVTGQVSRNEALQKLSQLSIYIQTSNWEGMPISLLEAMACELPVIVSDIPAHRNLITDSKNGYICRFDDEQDFIEKIEDLLLDIGARKLLATAGKEHVLKFHDVTTAIQHYADEYRGSTYSADPQTIHPKQ